MDRNSCAVMVNSFIIFFFPFFYFWLNQDHVNLKKNITKHTIHSVASSIRIIHDLPMAFSWHKVSVTIIIVTANSFLYLWTRASHDLTVI